MGLDQNGGQHFFQGRKGTADLSYNDKSKYDFHIIEDSKKEQIEAYYQWESNHLMRSGQQTQIVKKEID